MQGPASLGTVFVAIAVFFVSIALRDYLRTEDKMTIARRIWLRMVLIFAGGGVALYFAQIFLQ